MTEAPEKIWIGPGMPGYITDGSDGFYTVEYTRTDVALAMVAAEREACALTVEQVRDERCAKCGHPRSNHHYRHPFVGTGGIPDAVTAIRARTDADAQAALEKVKREAWNEALREAARYLQSQCSCSQVTCMAESDCNMDRQRAREILALMEDTDDDT